MKKIIFLILMICFFINTVSGEELIIENESISIELIVEQRCYEEQESIFHVERIEHTSGVEPLQLNYSMSCAGKNTSISKTINKYTTTKTGKCTFNQSKNYSIEVYMMNQTYFFETEIICQDINETLPQNITLKQNTSTEVAITNINETNNSELPSAENLSTEQQIIQAYNTTIHNTTDNISKHPPLTICTNLTTISLNKEIFKQGDQLTLDFILNPEPEAYEIEYGIETVFGEEIKKKRISTNSARKTHTFRNIEEKEQGAYVYALIDDGCHIYEHKKLILLINNQTSQEDVEEETTSEIIQDTTLNIHDVLQLDTNHISIELEIHRGSSRSSVVYLRLETLDGKIISEEKIKLLRSQSSIYLTTIAPSYEEDELRIIAQGLNLSDEKYIVLDKPKQEDNIHTSTPITNHTYTNSLEQTDKNKKTTTSTTTQEIYPQVLENTSLLPLLTKEEKPLVISSSTTHKALYGLFGTAIATSIYFLLNKK